MTQQDAVSSAIQPVLDLGLPDHAVPAAVQNQANLLALVSPEHVGADTQD